MFDCLRLPLFYRVIPPPLWGGGPKADKAALDVPDAHWLFMVPPAPRVVRPLLAKLNYLFEDYTRGVANDAHPTSQRGGTIISRRQVPRQTWP